MSASPRARMPSAWSKVDTPPLVTTGTSCPAARRPARTAAASGTLRPNGPRASEITVGMHSWPDSPVYGIDGLADLRLPGVLESAALGHRQVVRAGPRRSAARTRSRRRRRCRPPPRRGRGSGCRPRSRRRPGSGPCGAPPAEAAPAPGAPRRSRRSAGSSARGTRPSCRRARSEARRRRSPPRAPGCAASAKSPGRTRGRSRMCGRWRSPTRSR